MKSGLSISTIGLYGTLTLAGIVSAAYPTAEKILYCPIIVPRTQLYSTLFIGCGATASGNLALGVYNHRGVRLANTGSVAQAGSHTTTQIIAITPILLAVGNYYLAVTLDNTTGTTRRAPLDAKITALCGVKYEQPASFGLPAVATWLDAVDAYVPELGISI